VPIPGTTKLDRLEENLVAAEVVLSPDELTNISEGVATIPLQGARLPEALLQMTGR